MKRSVQVLIVIIALFFIALLTRPSEENFRNWIDQSTNIEDGGLINKAVSKGKNIQAKLMMEYTDAKLFSIVKTKELDKETTYFGMFGFWLKVS